MTEADKLAEALKVTAKDRRNQQRTLSTLMRGRALIGDEVNWTQNALARDSNLKVITPNNPDAVCWCSVGALARVVSEQSDYPAAMGALRGQLDGLLRTNPMAYSLSAFNDHSTHEQVMVLWDAAIAQQKVGLE